MAYDFSGINEIEPEDAQSETELVGGGDAVTALQRYDFSGIAAIEPGAATGEELWQPAEEETVYQRAARATNRWASLSGLEDHSRLDKTHAELRKYLGDGTPPASALTLSQATQQLKNAQMDHATRGAPHTAQWAVERGWVGRVPYDLPGLAKVEKSYGQLLQEFFSKPIVDMPGETPKHDTKSALYTYAAGPTAIAGYLSEEELPATKRVISAMPGDLTGGLLETVRGGLDVTKMLTDNMDKTGLPLLKFVQGLRTSLKAAGYTMAEDAQNAASEFLGRLAEDVKDEIPAEAGTVERGVRSGVTSMGGTVPMLLLAGPASAALRAEAAAGTMFSTGMGMSVAGNTYRKNLEKTGNTQQAALHGILDGMAEFVFEKLGGDVVLLDKAAWAKGFLGGVVKFAAREIPSEIATTLTQNYNDWVFLNPEKSLEDFMSEQPDAVLETIVATLVGGGGQIAVMKGLEAAANRINGSAQADVEQQKLQELFTAATEAELFQNDPQAFGEFMQGVAPDQEVRIDAALLEQALVDAGKTAADIPSLLEQGTLPGEVSVPMHELVTALAGTASENTVIQNIRTDPEARTIAERRELGNKALEEFKATGARTLEKKRADDRFQGAYEALRDELAADLEATGVYKPGAVSTFADITATMHSVVASRLGITPLQFRDGWTDAKGNAHRGYNVRPADPVTKMPIKRDMPAATFGGKQANGRVQANDFTPGRIGNILRRKDWAVITAENPNNTELSPEENAARNEMLRAELKAMGLTFEQIEGKYAKEGQETTAPLEHPFMVTGLDTDAALALAQKFEQDSVLTPHGFVYRDGTVHRALNATEHETEPANYWSRIPSTGALFTVNMDFSEKVSLEDTNAATGQTGDVRGRQPRGADEKLEGAPVIEGAEGPDVRLVQVAEKYARDNGIPYARQSEYVEVNPERAARIAAAYDAMAHAPDDPVVKEAYANLIEQTKAQYEALVAAGYKFYFTKPEDTYNGNPWTAMRDLRANQTMGVFPTMAGFGSGVTDVDVAENPLLADTGITWPDGSPGGGQAPVLANDLFRAVHDAFGHGLEGAGFRAQGEENAWQAHIRLFTGSAVAAITTETRGQNSWLNFGPYGEANQKAKVEDTVFADQKTGLMPEWTWTEGVAPDESFGQTVSTRTPTQKGGRADPHLTTDLAVDYGVVLEDAGLLERMAAVVKTYPGIRRGLRNPNKIVEAFIKHVEDNLTWLYDNVPAETRERSKLWYDGGRRIIERWADKYGFSDTQIAAVIAVLSPQTEWDMNVTRAERILDIWTQQQDFAWSAEMDAEVDRIESIKPVLREGIRGKTLAELDSDLLRGVWIRVYDQAHNPRVVRGITPEGGFAEFKTKKSGEVSTSTWGSFGEIGKAVRVLRDGSIPNISRSLGGEHKVRNFYNNLFDPTDPRSVTIDTHAVAAGHLRPLAGGSIEVLDNLGAKPRHDATGTNGTYVLYAEAYRRVAATKGILPRELQSITWEAVRRLFPDTYKNDTTRALIDAMWKPNETGKESADEIRNKILESRGGTIPDPAWKRSGTGLDVGQPSSTYQDGILERSWADGTPGTGARSNAEGVTLDQLIGDELFQAAKPEPITVVGIHFSPKDQPGLSPAAYGKGIDGAERARVMAAKDIRIKRRAHFYVNTGSGIFPEAGVGSRAHVVTLTNMYDGTVDPLGLFKDKSDAGLNVSESAVLDAGFDGYITRQHGNQGAAVVFQPTLLKPEFIGTQEEAMSRAGVAPAPKWSTIQKLRIKLNSAKNLPAFGPPDMWDRIIGKLYPEEHAILKEQGVFERAKGDLYKDELLRFAGPVGDELYQNRQDARGTFSPERLEYTLLAKADLSTFMHEMGHFYLKVYMDLALEMETRAANGETLTEGEQGILDDMLAVLEWMGWEMSAVGGVPGVLEQSARAPEWETLYRGENAGNKGGGFFTGDAEWARQFTQSGRESEVKKRYVRATDIYTPEVLAYGGDQDAVDAAIEEAKQLGYKAVRLSEGRGEPVSTFVFDRSALRITEPRFYQAETPAAPAPGKLTLAAWAAMSTEQQRPYHEKFAETWEQYLFTGKAPTKKLEGIFRRISDWMRRVYLDMKRFLSERKLADINPEISAVMDRMVATEREIAAAQERRAQELLFKNAVEAGMTPEQYAKYMTLPEEAKAEAEEQLRARALRDMKWVENRRNKTIAALQKEAAEKRKEMRAIVAEEVAEEPVFKAQKWLRHGIFKTDTGEEIQALKGHKLHISALEAMFPAGVIEGATDWRKLGYGKYGMLAADGIQPDMVAEMFGYRSGMALVDALLNAPNFKAEVEGRTDQRMLEKYGDLATPEGIARAADEAIMNDVRLKILATEMSYLNNTMGSPAAITRAARAYAQALIASRVVKNLKPASYAADAARAGKAAMSAFGKGDSDLAAEQKRLEVLHHASAREAYAAEKEINKIVARLTKISKVKNDDSGAKNRNMDVVNAVRVVLSSFGFGTVGQGENARKYLDALKQQEPDISVAMEDLVLTATANQKNWKNLKVSELRELAELVDSVWSVARRAKEMEIDGKRMSRQAIVDELLAAVEKHEPNTGKPDIGTKHAVTPEEQRKLTFSTFKALFRRVSDWAEAIDGGKKIGPFRKYVWFPIKDAADKYRAAKVDTLKQYRELLKPISGDFSGALIDAQELGYVFGKDPGVPAMSELLHAILHTGNDSNKRKLLLGRGWAAENADGTLDTTRWDRFIHRMQAAGTLTKAHYDFVQGVWDMLEGTKGAAQKAHRAVFGRSFDEVTANPFTTPFGTYAGGYVPAMVDSRIESDAALRELANAENESMVNAFPTPAKGFTIARVDYNRKLLLDLRTLAGHVDKVLLFSYLAEPIADVRRVLMSPELSKEINRIDPAAIASMFTPWLNRAAKQVVEVKKPGAGNLARFWSGARSRSGMAAMFANVVNTMQQFTGIFTAAVKVKPTYLIEANAQYLVHPKDTFAFVTENSPYMKERLTQGTSSMTGDVNDILINPGKYETVKAWSTKHAYFMQTAIDQAMGPIIWMGAYKQALDLGETHDDARKAADDVVRQTQGSQLPEEIANYEVGSPFYRMFTQFSGFFNSQANMLGTEFSKVSHELGLRKGLGRGFFLFTLGVLAPAMVSELIVQAFRGGPDDEDDDGEYLDDWISALTFGTARYVTAMAPGAGPAAIAVWNTFNHKPYDDRMSTAPAISMAEAGFRAPSSIYRAWAEDESGKPGRAIMDSATAVSMLLGVPARSIAKPIAYAADVEADYIDPVDGLDYARGLVTGTASPESKQ